jgi:hypothetical protein
MKVRNCEVPKLDMPDDRYTRTGSETAKAQRRTECFGDSQDLEGSIHFGTLGAR